MSKTFSTSGIVLKRSNLGECDRIVTLLTKDFGKLACVAKGTRKLASSKRALIEPGSYFKGFFVATKSMPLLTEVTLIDSASGINTSLSDFRKLYQMLEIFEKLFVEEELDDHVFDQVLQLRAMSLSKSGHAPEIRQKLGTLIESLGFQHPDQSDHGTISDYLSALLSAPLRSFEYLRVG
jgi:DNA repair protein RecO (recombination protein O)